jgi:hypothetical protein
MLPCCVRHIVLHGCGQFTLQEVRHTYRLAGSAESAVSLIALLLLLLQVTGNTYSPQGNISEVGRPAVLRQPASQPCLWYAAMNR